MNVAVLSWRSNLVEEDKVRNGGLVSAARNVTYSGKYEMAVSREPVIRLKYVQIFLLHRKGIEKHSSLP